MQNDVRVTKALKAGLEKYADKHILESVRAARAAYTADSTHFGMEVFGMALYSGLRKRFLIDLAQGETPFSVIQTGSNYPLPILEHGDLGQIAIFHHRVDGDNHLPKGDSGELLRKHVTPGQKDLFEGRRQATVARLLGIVGNPFDGFGEAFVGKIVPTASGSRRLDHQEMLDLGGGGGGSRGDGGEPHDGPEPESVDTPEVTREKVVSA
ncbi:hypothetical protein GGP78_003161 [Salinibacter ruber]|uniref:hypothetical protein n=1 Tax=Salinibacter ruber TaxID=146919 RepID=UPI0021686700|nr:hypothetical protein [Salinibacter ruber]MCS3856458.1 hypothetical protein [Salinibacter ruber]